MFLSNLLNFFPAPNFLNTPYAGLSMSDKHIRVISLEQNSRGGLSIKKYAELPLPPGAITGGRVNNKEQIVSVLTELRKITGIEYVRVSIPEEKAYLFELEIPLVEPSEIKSAIEFKIEENVPWPADKVVFDYVLTHVDTEHMKVVVSALPSKFVDIYMDLFSSSGFIPYVFEIESQAIARAILESKDMSTNIIAHFHKDKVGLCIVSGGLVHFTSTLSNLEGLSNDLSGVSSEIKKVISYWQTNRAGDDQVKMIHKIIVSGDIVTDTITSTLSNLIGVPVVPGNVWVNVLNVNDELPTISFLDSLKYAPAVGLALPSDSLI